MSADSDRTVHGATASGNHIVRYDRAGKWYIEIPYNPQGRVLIGTQEAAELAYHGTAFLGKPGGKAFDAKVRRLRKDGAA